MRRIILAAAAALVLTPLSVLAQTPPITNPNPVPVTVQPTIVGGQYNSSAPTLNNKQYAPFQFDINGNAKVVEGSSSPTVPFGAYSKSSITRPANTTTYTANTGWNNATSAATGFFSFTLACRVNGGQVLIPQIDIWSSANPTLKLTGVLWLFGAVPATNVSDDAAFTIAAADYANLLNVSGYAFTLANNQANAGATNSGVSLTGTTYAGRCNGSTTTITGMVEVTNAYVPASAEVLTVGLATVGTN